MLSEIQKKIIGTIAYYDEMSYPLTAFEVWKYLTNLEIGDKNSESVPLSKIMKTLEEKEMMNYIQEFEGFYFLQGRMNLVELRLKKEKISALKIKKLRKIIWLLRLAPYVRMIATTGRLAMKNSGKNSDWDLLIVLKQGKIWTGRTLITGLLQFMGKRRHGKKIKDRICLNYFITDESLKIDTQSRPFEINLFSASEYSFMIPLFGFKKFRKFQMRNAWIKDFKPNYTLAEVKNIKVVPDTHFSKIFRKAGEQILNFNFIESFLRKIEKEKIAKNPKTHKTGGIIEANDEMLVFLPEPQGKEIYERCREKLIALGII